MSKVYIVSWNGTSIAGGVERVVKYIEEVLSEKHEVVIVCDELLRRSSAWSRWLVQNSVIKAIGYSLYIAVHKKKGDYVISNGYQAPLAKVDYLWVHGSLLESRRRVTGKKNYEPTAKSILELLAAHSAKKIVCVASHIRREYQALYHVSSKKMLVITNPVDTKVFYPIKERVESHDLIRILFIGSIGERKGAKELHCLSCYIEKMQGCKLMIVTQSDKDATRIFANKRNTEVYTKIPFEKLNGYYNQADVLYFPSRYEGYEMVTLESLSAGVPVVGYPVGAINELSRKGQQGVAVLSDQSVETAFSQLSEMAKRYKSRQARWKLHEDIRSRCDIDVFKEKLKKEIHLL